MDEAISKKDSDLSGGNTTSSTTDGSERINNETGPDVKAGEDLDVGQGKETSSEGITKQSIDNGQIELPNEVPARDLNPQETNSLNQVEVSDKELFEGSEESLEQDGNSTTEKQTGNIGSTDISDGNLKSEDSSLSNKTDVERQQEASNIDIKSAKGPTLSIKKTGSSVTLNADVAKKERFQNEDGREQKESLIEEETELMPDTSLESEIREESSLDPIVVSMTEKTLRDNESVELHGSTEPVEVHSTLDKSNKISSDNKADDLDKEPAELGKPSVQEETSQIRLDNGLSSDNEVDDLEIEEGNRLNQEVYVIAEAELEDNVSVEISQTTLNKSNDLFSDNENVKSDINNTSNLNLIESMEEEETYKDKEKIEQEENLTPETNESTQDKSESLPKENVTYQEDIKEVGTSEPITTFSSEEDAIQTSKDDSSLREGEEDKGNTLTESREKSKKFHSGAAKSENNILKSHDFKCEENPKERALRYLEESGVLRMFQNLAAGIVQDRPEKPLLYMIDALERENQSE